MLMFVSFHIFVMILNKSCHSSCYICFCQIQFVLLNLNNFADEHQLRPNSPPMLSNCSVDGNSLGNARFTFNLGEQYNLKTDH